jgi:hypothetical protein
MIAVKTYDKGLSKMKKKVRAIELEEHKEILEAGRASQGLNKE